MENLILGRVNELLGRMIFYVRDTAFFQKAILVLQYS